MKTKNFAPLKITAADNGVIIEEHYREHMVVSKDGVHVFNNMSDLCRFLEHHIVEIVDGPENATS